jgi:hypothetical protein
LSVTVTAVADQLRQLGVLASTADVEMPTELVVRVLTDDEHDELKRKAEEMNNDYED